MFRILGLDHVVLRVRDVQAMMAFYANVLGCELVRSEPELGLYQLRAGRSLIDLVPVDSPLGRPGGAAPAAQGRNMEHLCLRIEPFNEIELRVHMREAGVEMSEVAQRYGAEGRGPSVYVSDPEGNLVELKGPAQD